MSCLFSSLLCRSVMQTLAALVSLDFSSTSSGQGIHQVALGRPPCPAAWDILELTTLFVSVSQGPVSLCCLMFSVSETVVSNVFSGWLCGGFGWKPVPVIPSWLEAESLICIFLSRGTFPILNSVENSTVQIDLTP